MFKKWQNYLLEHHPHIWNMRLPAVLAMILVLHLFHFLVGYLHFGSHDLSDGIWDHPGTVFFSSSFALFSIIGSVLVFIVWLSRVFRNNPFKSYYPYSNGQLFRQFLMILLVSFLNVNYFYSYTLGFAAAGSRGMSLDEAKAAGRIYNRLYGCLQDRKEAYAVESRCDEYPFPLRKLVNPDRSGLNSDMLQPDDFFYESNDGRRFSASQVDSMTGGEEYSFLNYCNSYPVLPVELDDPRMMNGQLRQGAILRDSLQLRADMVSFVSLLDKYHIAHTLSAEQWYRMVYRPPYFPVKQLIRPYASASGYTDPEHREGYFMDHYEFQRMIRTSFRVRQFSFSSAITISLLYLALGITLFIFTFRATEKRAWMITIIGGGVICLLVGLLSALIAIGGAPEALVGFYLLTIAGFFLMHLLSTSRSWSAAALNWFTLSLPYVSLILLAWSETWRTSSGGSKRFSAWAQENAPSYFFTCLLLYIVIVRLVLVPAYRRWQAMPE